jgi:Protein of unknown function (DUF1566)
MGPLAAAALHDGRGPASSGSKSTCSTIHHTQEAAMKASRIKLLGILAAGLVAVLAEPASAQLSTTANGPYYATPSWDQKFATNRFVILANWNSEAVLDRETGVVWQRAPDPATLDLTDAIHACNTKNIGNRLGWRLPTIQELASLVDPSIPTPGLALPAGHPFVGVQSTFSIFFSGTRIAVGAVWSLDFDNISSNNGVFGSSVGGGFARAWCVRGGQGPDIQ